VIPDPSRHQLFPPFPDRPLLRWSIALGSTALLLGLSAVVPRHFELWVIISVIAVIGSASVAGWKAGLLSAGLCVMASGYVHVWGSPEAVYRLSETVHALLFIILAVIICWFFALLYSTERSRRGSEEKFRSLVMNAPYGICRCTPEGVILETNPAMTSMLRCSTPMDLVQRCLSELYRDPDQFSKLLDRHGLLTEFDGVRADWKRWDDSPMVVRLYGRPIRDEQQNVAFELFTEDVTERHALEQQFRQAQKMEAVGRLAGGVAHDFNNLLMVISGYSELLLERLASGSELRLPAQEILNATDRAASLTRQLLAFSRKQVQTPRVVDLNAIMAEHLKMLPRLIGEDIRLMFVPGALSGQVCVDPGQIQQVIMNLAVNARDAMPNGGKLIIETANVHLDDQYTRHQLNLSPGEYVLLTVTDTGNGMDADTQSHIFEPFFTTKGQKGTGLGLSTVYGIVEQSAGHIQVESRLGQGTTFKIYLPHVAETGQSAEEACSITQAPSGRETVLVVEDEMALRTLTRAFLEAHGYRVLEAENSDAAIHISATFPGPIHLLLTDVIMPGMNGRDLAVQLTRSRLETRVLYMSGYTENAVGRNGTLDSQVSLLQKPFTSKTLAQRVREALDSATSTSVVPSLEPVRGAARRAPRYTMQLPLQFRLVGESQWEPATTENISRSGVLFRTKRRLSTAAQIEVQLMLPVEITGDLSVEVACEGEVVRMIDAAPAVPAGVAAKILKYQFLRQSVMAQA
jgi:PAS domain S-box-containing protein